MHDIASEFSYPQKKKIHNGIFLTMIFLFSPVLHFSLLEFVSKCT